MKRARIPALCLVLLFLLTAATHAGDAELQAMMGSGQCGENITWNLDAAGTLTITGTGDFYGEDSENYLPWRYFKRYIVSVNISNAIATVPDYAFRECDYLQSVTLGKDVRTVGEEAFEYCTRLTDISGTANLEVVGETSFARCPALADFDFPGVKSIGAWAFYDSGLVNVTIPDSVTEIGEGAFENCAKLESVSVGQGVTYLDRHVFSCPALKEIRLPVTVTAIDENAVSGSDLLTVYYAGTAAQWDKIRGGGTDTLQYYAERVYFESTRAEDVAPMMVSISNATFYRNQVSYTIHFDGNGIQNVNVITAYYDESGKFIGIFNDWIRLPDENGRREIGHSAVDTENAKTAKIFVLDCGFRPLCPSLSENVEQ